MLYIPFLVVIYLINERFLLLTDFIKFPLPPTPIFGNCKADLFYYEVFFFGLFVLFLKYNLPKKKYNLPTTLC